MISKFGKFILNLNHMATKKTAPEEVASAKQTPPDKKAKEVKKAPLKKAHLKPVIPSSLK